MLYRIRHNNRSEHLDIVRSGSDRAGRPGAIVELIVNRIGDRLDGDGDHVRLTGAEAGLDLSVAHERIAVLLSPILAGAGRRHEEIGGRSRIGFLLGV